MRPTATVYIDCLYGKHVKANRASTSHSNIFGTSTET